MTNRVRYLEELDYLQHQILRMGCLMEEAVRKSIEALVKQDTAIAEEVIKSDDVIDNLEHTIEGFCIKLIATEQPVSRDLRIIFTALKIITDLERMADHAVDIAKIAIRLANEQYMKKLIDIPRMAEIAIGMVKDSLNAYVKHDVKLAEEICIRDDEVDGIYSQMFRELLTYMMQDPQNINQATYFLFVGKYLERIADHATNVCEWVIYVDTGEHKELNS